MKTDYKTVHVEIKDGVALLTMDNPPVNQMSERFGRELAAAIGEAFQDDEVKALVLTGTGKNFLAGADITQVYPARDKEEIFKPVLEMAQFLNSIEIGPKPVIAAINGNALGGGLETAMSCHYRIAASGAQLGQPEVQIGLIPGSGGTQRLPRLIGLPYAIEMITAGKPIKAELGQKRGLIDEVTAPEQLLDKALAAAKRFISGELKIKTRITRNVFHKLPSAAEKKAIVNFAREMAAGTAKGYIAPFKAIEAIEKGLSFDIEADIEKEVDIFCDMAISDIAKNLMGIFLNTRAAGKLPQIKDIQPARIKKVVLLGGGVMGSGITNLLLSGGYEIVLWDVNDEAIKKALAAIRKTYQYPIKKRKMTRDGLEGMIQNQLTTTTSLEDAKNSDLIIEAVLEDMKIKQDIWKRLQDICRPDTVFSTNTSALPIGEMGSVLTDPGRLIGLHFFNPAHRMQLLEIILGEKTSNQTLAASVAFARAIKKIPIVVNDGPGFYVSRQLFALMGGAIFLMADGVDPAIIEEAITDFGMPMGPGALNDLTGIDIGYHVSKTYERTLGERYKIHPLFERIYQTGCYGRKTGAGFFDYSGPEPVPNKKVMDVVEQYLKENGVSRKEVSKQEIVDLMLANGINEAALMIEAGICDRPQDMDLAMIYGTGFPPYRGGILRYADSWGIENINKTLKKLEKQYGPRFAPANLLKDMAGSGKIFYQDL